ncbi:hypothetical protein C1I97_25340, partial [Streptomyces sp. NTH33]
PSADPDPSPDPITTGRTGDSGGSGGTTNNAGGGATAPPAASTGQAARPGVTSVQSPENVL